MCFTWDSVCQWVLCTGPTASLIAKFSLECVCQWVPNVCVLRPFLFLVLCLCVYVYVFLFKKKKKIIYWEVCFTWDSVCQWVLCTGPTTSLIAKFSLECVCQWVPNVCVLRPFFIFGVAFVRLRFPFFFFFF